MKRLFLLSALVALLPCCANAGSDYSPAPNPDGILVNVDGAWTGTSIVTRVSLPYYPPRDPCEGASLAPVAGDSSAYSIQFDPTSASGSLRAVVTDTKTGVSMIYRGMFLHSTSIAIAATATDAATPTTAAVRCSNGQLQFLQVNYFRIEAEISGNRGTGTLRQTWDIRDAGSGGGLGQLYVESSFDMAR